MGGILEDQLAGTRKCHFECVSMVKLQGRSRIDLELPCPQTDRACNFQRAAGGFDGPVVDERSRNRGGGGDIFQRSPGIDLKYSSLDRRVAAEGECVAC